MDKLYAGTNEEQTPVEGVVKGTIPKWISGSLFRNGPAMYEVGGERYLHLFDGMAAIQKFEVKNGKAVYSRKFVKSQTYKKNMAANKIVVSEFGTLAYYPDPCKTLFQRFFSLFVPDESTDNTSVSVWPLKDRLFASTETNVIHEIDPDNLDTIDRVNISHFVSVDSATAHPHWDQDGTVHNIGYSYKGHPSYCLVRIPAKPDCRSEISDIKLVASVKSRWRMNPGYYHSFAVTDNYYIFIEQPLVLNIFKILTQKLRGIPISDCLDWHPNEKTIIHIIDKKTGEEVNSAYKYQSDSFFVFHHANAYEEDGHIVMDICTYKDDKIIKLLAYKNFRENYEAVAQNFKLAKLERFVLPLNIDNQTKRDTNLVTVKGTDATATLISDGNIHCTGENILNNTEFEFPQVNYSQYNGKKYRYLYGVGKNPKGEDGTLDSLLKVDMENKTSTIWSENFCFPSEPVFVANPDGLDEDDGVILSAINSTEEGKYAYLLVLDAKTFEETARVEFPDITFPRDFHGIFRND